MKKLLVTWAVVFIAGFFLPFKRIGQERFVNVAAESIPKSVAISIPAVMEQLVFHFENGGLSVEKSTVAVTVKGAGVFISPNGHILTCAHLFELENEGIPTVCQSNGECSPAELMYKEERLDLALLRIETKKALPYARIADPRTLQIGQEVLAIGTPLGIPFVVTHGILGAFNIDGLGVYNMNQSDAFINPGNSGGPLFNLRGELVGINSRMLPPVPDPIFTGLGFSVSPAQINEFLVRFKGLEKLFRR